MNSSNFRWLVLLTSFLSFVAYAFVFQLVPPLLKAIDETFLLSEAESGLLMSAVVAPGIFLALPAGLLINKYGFRPFGFVSIISVALGSLITATASNYSIVLLGRLVLGVGGAFITIGTPTVIPQWFSRKDLGKAMGIYSINMPVAVIASFFAATVLVQSQGWRYLFYVGTVISFVCAMIFAITIREGRLSEKGKPTATGEVKKAIMNGEVWKASVVWMFFNGAVMGFLSWTPKWFQDFKDLDPLYASFLASIIMYCSLVAVPFFGWASDRLRRRRPFIATGSVLLALALIATAITFNQTLFLSVIILGIAAAMVPPLVMTITGDSLPSNLTGIGFSVLALCQNIGITFSVPLVGYIMQITGSLLLSFAGLALCSFIAFVVSITLKTR